MTWGERKGGGRRGREDGERGEGRDWGGEKKGRPKVSYSSVLTGEPSKSLPFSLCFGSPICSKDLIYCTEVLRESNEVMLVTIKEQFSNTKESEKGNVK